MGPRILEELALIREGFPDAKFVGLGRWILVPAYPLPMGWNRERTDVAFQVNELHPGSSSVRVLCAVRPTVWRRDS